jgi:tRNA (cytidine/uridine-2'-O-)-methyltransferase
MARIEVVLVSPRIPQNVGAIGRLCAAMAVPLHVIRPVPFRLDDASLRRSGMDYLEYLDLRVHVSWEEFREAMADRRRWLFTTRGAGPLPGAAFQDGDLLLFGNEPDGAPPVVHDWVGEERRLRIPMREERARSLNLAMACAMGVYEALRPK